MAGELLGVCVVIVGGTDSLGKAIRLGKDVFELGTDQPSLILSENFLTIDAKILLDAVVNPDDRKIIVENEDTNG